VSHIESRRRKIQRNPLLPSLIPQPDLDPPYLSCCAFLPPHLRFTLFYRMYRSALSTDQQKFNKNSGTFCSCASWALFCDWIVCSLFRRWLGSWGRPKVPISSPGYKSKNPSQGYLSRQFGEISPFGQLRGAPGIDNDRVIEEGYPKPRPSARCFHKQIKGMWIFPWRSPLCGEKRRGNVAGEEKRTVFLTPWLDCGPADVLIRKACGSR
jgi:hypothetical protein